MTGATTPAIVPLSREVSANGKTYTLKRLSALQTMEASNSLFALYQAIESAPEQGMGVAGLISAAPVAIIDLLSISLDEPFDAVADMDPIEFLDVAEAWWEVNGRFFVERLLPRVMQMLVASGALRVKSEAQSTSASPSKKRSSTSASRGRATKTKR